MKRTTTFWMVFLIGVIVSFTGARDMNIDQQVDSLLQKMTFEEKINLLGGTREFYLRAIPHIGSPEVQMADGPLGIRGNGRSTAFPANMALSASWNPELAYKVGEVIGRECRQKEIGFILAPAINIYRAAQCGRNFEYMGEDPYLVSRMVVPYVKGVQKNKVVATVKHFVANNQEYDRHWVSSDVYERTLHEIYFPAFKAAIQEGGALAVMTAYNPLNGVHCSENAYLLEDILRKEWGFRGIVMSDWGAVHSVRAITAGLDLEMPEANYMNAQNIKKMLAAGEIDTSLIDNKVRNILRVCLQMDLFEKDKDKPIVDWEQHHQVALQVAREGIVLLKNEADILPISTEDEQVRILVLGPNADPTPTSGGGSAHVIPYQKISMWEGIQEQAPKNVKVDYINISRYPAPERLFVQSKFYQDEKGEQPGIKAIFFNNTNLRFPPISRRVDTHLDFDFGISSPAPTIRNVQYSIRWYGYIIPEKSGLYVLMTESDDGVRVYVDNKLIIDNWTDHALQMDTAELELEAGKAYSLKIEYYNNLGNGTLRFGYGLVDNVPLEEKISRVKKYDYCVVCVGFNAQMESEGFDRPFSLPEEQNNLINKVAAMNANTIVVLNAGGGIDFTPWIDNVKAVLHCFYLGQVGGSVVGEILFGKTNPSGKLPFSIEKKWEDNPVSENYYVPGEAAPLYRANHENNMAHVEYKEGIFLGYRYYDTKGVEPLFPFGFGLSYTSFAYSDLRLSTEIMKLSDTLRIQCTVTNTGTRSGAEIVQLYISDAVSSFPRPVKELKGFRKVFLEPGQSTSVEFQITREHLSFYNPQEKVWQAEPGEFEVLLGSSSRDIRLRAKFQLQP